MPTISHGKARRSLGAKDGFLMANNNTNAAEDLTDELELEVVEGESTSVVEPGEITALLDEMAKQNEEAEAAAKLAAEALEADPAKVDAVAVADEAAAELPIVDGMVEVVQIADDAPPGSLETNVDAPVAEVEVASVAAPVETGPSFTMEDVLRAASESTSFSVDEIKNYEPEPEVEEFVELNDEADETDVHDELDKESDDEIDAGFDSKVISEEENPKSIPKKEGVASEDRAPVAAILGDWRDWVRKPIFIGAAAAVIAVAALFVWTRMQVSGVEKKLSAKQKTLETTLDKSNELLSSLNDRFASMDRALQSGGSKHMDSRPTSTEHQTVHQPNVVGQSPSAKVAKVDHKAEAVHKPASSHSTVLPHKAESHHVAKPTGPSGDHYDASALVEGFKGSKLLIAKHSAVPTKAHSRKSSHRVANYVKPRATNAKHYVLKSSSNGTSVRVYDSSGRPLNRVTVHAPAGH